MPHSIELLIVSGVNFVSPNSGILESRSHCFKESNSINIHQLIDSGKQPLRDPTWSLPRRKPAFRGCTFPQTLGNDKKTSKECSVPLQYGAYSPVPQFLSWGLSDRAGAISARLRIIKSRWPALPQQKETDNRVMKLPNYCFLHRGVWRMWGWGEGEGRVKKNIN